MANTVSGAFNEFMREKINLNSEDTKKARISRDNLIDNIHIIGAKDGFFNLYTEKDIMICISGKWINNKRELAAIIQEEFDNNVLGTDWNDEKYGAKDIHNQEINKYKIKYVEKFKKDDWESNLKNWYDVQYSQMPLTIGKIYCQATNINWDKELRIKFEKILYTVLIVILLILFVISSINNNTFLETLEFVFLPSALIVIYLIQIIMANNKTIRELDYLRKHLDTIIIAKDSPNIIEEKLSELSNGLQEKIYEYRKNAFLIPDRLYYLNKDKQEGLSNSYATMEKENNKISK